MAEWREFLTQMAGQQTGQIHLVLFAPLLTVVFLSLLVHTASSAIDPALEKQKVTEQLKRRLSELQSDRLPLTLSEEAAPTVLPSTTPTGAAEETARAQAETCLAMGGWQMDEGQWRTPALLQRETMAVHVGSRSTSTPSFTDSFLFTVSPLQGQAALRFSCPHAEPADPIAAVETSPTEMAGRRLVNEPAFMLKSESFAVRLLRVIVAFEHGERTPDEAFGTVVGNFDGQGVSFGLLQWNLGRCTLQPLFRAFQRTDPDAFSRSLEGGTAVIEILLIAPCHESVQLARRLLLDEDGRVPDVWIERFQALGRERVFQALQLAHLRPLLRRAARLARALGLQSERAVALCFDSVLQNGGIPRRVQAQYRQEVDEMTRALGRAPTEVERMLMLAHWQAEAARPQWVEAVRARKVAIACGEGRVNGLRYRLDAAGITLRPYPHRS